MSQTPSTPSYKDTLNLPQTAFPMKANLAQNEPQIIERWKQKNIHEKMVKQNAEQGSFSMPDGPPYANGNLHMGHALNKILKDIVIKYKNMAGYASPFIPGWDCHGLPIELSVTKNLGSKRAEKNDAEIRALCRKEAQKWVDVQRTQFIRFGVLGDWDNPYLTMSPQYEADEVRVLAKILKTGAFYRGEKPVYWCAALQTALAEAEVEYKDHTSPSIYVKFYVKSGFEKLKTSKSENVAFVIWTTTPWTLPANLAIAVHPDFEYGLFKSGNEFFVIAKALQESFEKETGLQLTLKNTIKGADLENIQTQHPMYERPSPILLGQHVTLDTGTGCVHTAPGHGQEDYALGIKYGLPIYSPVDEKGQYTHEVKEYEGQNVFKVNPLIVERLRTSGHLVHASQITHSYPHCWRSKTPLIFRSTPQWFLKMDEEPSSIRKKALEFIQKVRWVPSWGENRITSMIENRPDWCLSRQRIWGVPIPVFYCTKCQTELINETIMNRVADAMEENGGIEAYHETPISEFIQTTSCSNCGHKEFKKGQDILDVWFDSGVCFQAVQQRRKGLTQPADLYLEGSDQHRGWFHTSLLASIAAENRAPFKTVLTHGFVMYAKGQKMSKSLGNVVDPTEIIKQRGAELLRLWAAHEDYAQDLTCSTESFERLTETYRRQRNVVRFLLGNLSDFDPAKDSISYPKMLLLDQWILAKSDELVKKVISYYDNYEFYKIYHALNQFVTVELSAVYLDILKDRLYTWKKNGLGRRSAQTALHEVLTQWVGMMAPILSFLAEETYDHMPGKKEESVFLTPFPKPQMRNNTETLLKKFEAFLKLRDDVLKVLENLRKDKVIGASLEAKVAIQAENESFELLKELEPQLAEYFIVSQVHLKKGPFKIQAEPADGDKCPRCWKYSTETDQNKFPGLCPQCVEALT